MSTSKALDIAQRRDLSRLFSALAHPHRVQLVQLLASGELDVNTLSEQLNCTQSRVSQQLALLRTRGIVDVRRDGRHAYYRLRDGGLSQLLAQATDLLPGLRAAEAVRAWPGDPRVAVQVPASPAPAAGGSERQPASAGAGSGRLHR